MLKHSETRNISVPENGLYIALNQVFSQLRSFILLLPEGAYSSAMDILNGNSIGKHCRHILEIMENLARGMKLGVIDYESRQRQILYEVDPHAFLEHFQTISNQLLQVPDSKSIRIKTEPFPGQCPPEYPHSTLGRELVYNMEHMIHHMALIRIAARSSGLEHLLNEEFGVAFSTLHHPSK